MKVTLLLVAVLMFGSGLLVAGEVATFNAYVDSDLCARLMSGPISPARIECSQSTHKQGADPVLVRLRDNTLFDVNKQKMIDQLVGGFAEISGDANVKDGTIKLQGVKPMAMKDLPRNDPGRKLLDVRTSKAPPGLFEKIRHELAMMPYIGEFDFISFTMNGPAVILTGWTVRIANRSEAYNRVKLVQGVGNIVNNIEVLPMGSLDNRIRAGTRARLQQFLSRYFWRSGSDIKIIVKNGDIILLGVVASKSDSDLASVQANSVPGALHVFNMLRVEAPQKKS